MIDISLNQLKTLLNYQSNGTFATSAAKTTGTLQLNANGKLQNANRHWYSRDVKDAGAQQNFQIRQALVETFRKNNASNEFLAQVKDTLGLDTNSLSSGKADAKGVLESSKPLERRVVKQLITAFEQSREGRDLSADFEAVDKKALETRMANDAAEEVPLDPATQHMNRLAEASKTFMRELTDGLGGLEDFDVNNPIRKLQLQNVQTEVEILAQEVGSGQRTAFDALENLAYFLYEKIGDQKISEIDTSKVAQDARSKVIHDALNNFAAAMGATGKRPLLTVIKENVKTKLVEAVANFKTPIVGEPRAQKDLIIDFARNTYKTLRPLEILFARDQQLCNVRNDAYVPFGMMLDEMPDCGEKCKQQNTRFANVLRFAATNIKDVPPDDRLTYLGTNEFLRELTDELFDEKTIISHAQLSYQEALESGDEKAIAEAKAAYDKSVAVVNSADSKFWLHDILLAMGMPNANRDDINEMEAYMQEQQQWVNIKKDDINMDAYLQEKQWDNVSENEIS